MGYMVKKNRIDIFYLLEQYKSSLILAFFILQLNKILREPSNKNDAYFRFP